MAWRCVQVRRRQGSYSHRQRRLERGEASTRGSNGPNSHCASVLAVFLHQLGYFSDVSLLRRVLGQSLFLLPRVPFILSFEVQHARASYEKRERKEILRSQNISPIPWAFPKDSPVFTSPTVPCLNRAQSSNSSSSAGVVLSCFTSSAAALKLWNRQRLYF